MLQGIHEEPIIVGSYTSRDGGVCPMLAAHRRGGRTSLASFARAWDRYTAAPRRARRATQRELRTLTAMLESSLASDERADTDLADAVKQLQASKAERSTEPAAVPAARHDTGERDRTEELRRRPGWAWLRVFRRHDEYEAALAQIEAQERAQDEAAERPERELEPV